MGAEAIKKLLEEIDLDVEIDKLRNDMTEALRAEVKKNAKRLKVMEAFKKSGNKPELDGDGRAAGAAAGPAPAGPAGRRPLRPPDLNDLYRRVINRNNRLARLLELKAPRSSSATRSACCRRPWTRCSTTAAAARRSPGEQARVP